MENNEHKISVVINTYNAAAMLEEVIRAAEGFDEVLVCDMESTDDTVAIAERLGARVVTFPKADHKSAEPARTFAIQSALCPWVLVVDADEIITAELRDYLYQRISQPDCPQGLYIPRKGYFMHRLFAYPDYQLRFFIREGTVWPPYVHTFPTVQGRIEYIPSRRRELALIHLADDSIRTRVYKPMSIPTTRSRRSAASTMAPSSWSLTPCSASSRPISSKDRYAKACPVSSMRRSTPIIGLSPSPR